MSMVALRGVQGGWEVTLDGTVIVWDVDLDRAAIAAVCVHARRSIQSPIALCPKAPPEALERANQLMRSDIFPESVRRPQVGVGKAPDAG